MFDAKKLLDAFVTAGQQMSSGGNPGGARGPGQGGPAQSLGDGGSGGGLGGILDQLKNAMGQGGGQADGQPGAHGGPQGGLGGLGDLGSILGQVLGQATSGVKQAAGQASQATGAGDKLNDLLRQISGGKGSDELLAKAKQIMQGNQMGAGAVLGGLAAVLLGTGAGRGAIGTAAKLGGIALIGGLAYKAVQNYQAGKPLIAGLGGAEPVTTPAPAGSGYEPAAATNEAAAGYLRAMIAAASADGKIDEQERGRIVGAFHQSGLDKSAAAFLEREFARPASLDELAAEASTPEIAVQMYTAARVAVDANEPHNKRFLGELATQLGIAPELAGHIDAQARAAA